MRVRAASMRGPARRLRAGWGGRSPGRPGTAAEGTEVPPPVNPPAGTRVPLGGAVIGTGRAMSSQPGGGCWDAWLSAPGLA